MRYKKKYMKLTDELKKLCINHYKDRLVCLVVFGSVAKGTFSPTSDLDLLIILTRRLNNYSEYIDYFENIESKLSIKNLKVKINPIFKTRQELDVRIPYLWDTEFLILYDKDGFFRQFQERLQEFKKNSLIFHNKGMPYIEVKV